MLCVPHCVPALWVVGALVDPTGHWVPVGSERGDKADQAIPRGIQATAKPPAGVPRRSSLISWALEGEPEFRRTRCRALQQRGVPSAPHQEFEGKKKAVSHDNIYARKTSAAAASCLSLRCGRPSSLGRGVALPFICQRTRTAMADREAVRISSNGRT